MCLLRVGWHESGSVDDAYAVLKARDQAGTLMPNEQDYQEAPAPVGQARQTPGREVRGVIAGRLGVGVLVEVAVIAGEEESLEEIWVGSEVPPLPGATELPPQPEWIMTVPPQWCLSTCRSTLSTSAAAFHVLADPSRTASSSAGSRSVGDNNNRTSQRPRL